MQGVARRPTAIRKKQANWGLSHGGPRRSTPGSVATCERPSNPTRNIDVEIWISSRDLGVKPHRNAAPSAVTLAALK
jgi:hypothetical protein